MSTVLTDKTIKGFPISVQNQVAKMAPDQREEFAEEYNRQKKSKSVAYLWLIFGGFHYFYLNKPWIQIAFFCTFYGCFVWWLLDLGRTSRMVDARTKDIAIQVLATIKMINS